MIRVQNTLRYLLLVLFCLDVNAQAEGIDNPGKYLFAADVQENFISVHDIASGEQIAKIQTSFRADSIIVTPYEPQLFYANRDHKVLVAYNLQTVQHIRDIPLSTRPEHLVLDTTGKRIAVSDSKAGGFALISAYQQSVIFELPEFPATGQVLFDANEIDIYYSDNQMGTLGILDTNLREEFRLKLDDGTPMALSSPSRSLDGRHIYIANNMTGEVYSLNAYSHVLYKTFNIGAAPVRPYTTPEGMFLFLMDKESGQFRAIEQHRFSTHVDFQFDTGIDLVAVGRFDRVSLFMSSTNNRYHVFDNLTQKLIGTGTLKDTPKLVQASADGRTAFIVFKSLPDIGAFNLEKLDLNYFTATQHGVSGFTLGLSNNVCH